MIPLFLLVAGRTTIQKPSPIPADWSRWVRLCGNGLERGHADALVRGAVASGVYGLEVDNDPTGRYATFLDPTPNLDELREVAVAAHRLHNPVFAYLAGTECITPNADRASHSMFKDHPDWVQRDIKGRPAVFGGGQAFWITKGDEDVWVSPYAPVWRRHFMEVVRQMAATGIDGVYVDVPYWMTHFDGWDTTWASFDRYTVAAFRAETGLDARTQVKIGDKQDPGFRKWITFRIRTITNFIAEIDRNVKAVNPRCLTIPEIFPGYDEEASIVGADTYELAKVADVVCHEFNPGDRSSLRTQHDWMTYVVGMEAFRSFAEGRPTWMLTYSWSGEKLPTRQDAMQNLAAANVFSGANMWDAGRMVMSGSNDLATRKRIFDWIKENQKLIYAHRRPMKPIGVYFSPATRNFAPTPYTDAFWSAVSLLLQGHREFEIVTPRTLAAFRGPTLLLPGVRCVSDGEFRELRKLTRRGTTLRTWGSFADLDGEGAVAGPRAHLAQGKSVAVDLGSYANLDDGKGPLPEAFAKAWSNLDLGAVPAGSVEIVAPPEVVASSALTNGRPTVWLNNFGGLGPGKPGAPTPVNGIRIGFPKGLRGKIVEIPFLSPPRTLSGQILNGRLWCNAPPLERGAIIRLER